MNPKNFIVGILAAGYFISVVTLMPSVGNAQMDKVRVSMEALKAKTAKLEHPRSRGKNPSGAKMSPPFILARPR